MTPTNRASALAQAASDLLWATSLLDQDQAARAINTAQELLEEALQTLSEATG